MWPSGEKEDFYVQKKTSPIKHSPEIERLLRAIQKPLEMAVLHFRGHKRETRNNYRNTLAPKAAKKAAATETIKATTLALLPQASLPLTNPKYTPTETDWLNKEDLIKTRADGA